MSAFLAMGGYAAFVWPAYAATFLVLGGAIWLALREHARARADLKRLEAENSQP